MYHADQLHEARDPKEASSLEQCLLMIAPALASSSLNRVLIALDTCQILPWLFAHYCSKDLSGSYQLGYTACSAIQEILRLGHNHS